MRIASMKKRISIIIFAIIALLAVLIFIGSYYTDRLFEPFLADFLEKNQPLKHQITYEKLRVNLASRQIKIIGIQMTPDTALSRDENVWMDISVSSLKLTDFSIRNFLFHKQLMIGDLEFIKPSVTLHLPEKHPDQIRAAAAESSAKKINLASFNGLSLKNILLEHGEFKLYQETALIASSDDLDFSALDITIERGAEAREIIMNYGESSLIIKNLAWMAASSLYDIRVGELQITNADSTVLIHNITISPKHSKTEFSGMLDFQNDRFDLKVGKVSISGIGYKQWLGGQPAVISNLLVEHLDADIYRDKNVAFNYNKYPLFYNEAFLRIPIPLVIDTFSILNSTIQYGEMSEGHTEPGIIRLEEFSAHAEDLRNFPDTAGARMAMLLKVKARVMGEGPLNVELDLPLEGNLRKFRCRGSVGAMELSPLNSMLEPAINMRFDAGKLTRMTFDFTANDDVSNGWMEFLYQDLDVVILKKNPEKQWGFLTRLANTAVLTNNPPPGKKEKSVEIGYERNKNKGIINYIWKTIQSGLVRTIIPINKYQLKQAKASSGSK